MTRIDPGSSFIAYIQAHAQRIAVPDDKKRRLESTKKTPEHTADWLELVARSVAAISPEDIQKRRKAFRIFLEAGLAREFGIKDTKGSEFQNLLNQVNDAMLTDPRIVAAIERAGEMLIRSADEP